MMNTNAYSFPEFRRRYIRQHSQIIATASVFPDRVMTNQEIIDAGRLPVTDVVIRKTLGVEMRRVAQEGVTDSDLLAQAARLCLEKANLEPDQLSRILVTKFLGDRLLPMTAALVQRKLNCHTAMHAVDLEGGINAFLCAIDLATRYISTMPEDQQYILVLSGGIHRLPVSKTDPRLAFLFGDGAAAVLLSPAQETHFLASYIYTNNAYFQAAGTKSMKIDREISENLFEKGEYDLLFDLYQMGNWKDSVDFYLQAAQITRDRLLEESGLSMNNIDWVLVTENNRRMRDLTLESLGVPQDRSLSVIREYGNTMTAMLPILLDKAFQDDRLESGMNVMLISHGEGASGGGMIYRI
jgi:3-oxoacyl-[acyl-carrier-protein] synthase-3